MVNYRVIWAVVKEFFGFCFVGLILLLAYNQGYWSGVDEMERKAIAQGYGYYDEIGERLEFKWKRETPFGVIPPPPPKDRLIR